MSGGNRVLKTGSVLGALTGMVLLSGCVAHAHPHHARPVVGAAIAPSGAVYVKVAPPSHRPHHARPSRPGPNAVWINGRWKWTGHRHVWVKGHWTARPHTHRNGHWVPGHWNNTRHGWHWIPGRWR